MIFQNKKTGLIKRFCSLTVVTTFLFLTVLQPQKAQAQTVLNLPIPGTMLSPSIGFTPTIVKGLTIDPDNPLRFNFIVDTGNTQLEGEAFKGEAKKLINYFLASLTVPEEELWVNLSPYEKDRIIPESFGVTEMGRDLLAQDYLLKQLTASLVYPEDELGAQFWQRVYQRAQQEYGTTDVPINTFNKVWIVPDKAAVYEHEGSVFVVERHLKVMLEEDYTALRNGTQSDADEQANAGTISGLSSKVVREILIPEIEKEINEGKNFANLRQVYNSMILATWYKKNLKESLLGQVYMDQNKVKGVDIADKQAKFKIYDQYLKAFNKGVYDYIREDYDSISKTIIPKKYFSGGMVAGVSSSNLDVYSGLPSEMPEHIITAASSSIGKARLVTADLFAASDSIVDYVDGFGGKYGKAVGIDLAMSSDETNFSSSPLTPSNLIFKRAIWDRILDQIDAYDIGEDGSRDIKTPERRKTKAENFLNVWREDDTDFIATKFGKDSGEVRTVVSHMIKGIALEVGANIYLDRRGFPRDRQIVLVRDGKDFSTDLKSAFVESLENRRGKTVEGEELLLPDANENVQLYFNRGEKSTLLFYSRDGRLLFSRTIEVPAKNNLSVAKGENIPLWFKDVDSGDEFMKLDLSGADEDFDITIQAHLLYDSHELGNIFIKNNSNEIFSVVKQGFEQQLFIEKGQISTENMLLVSVAKEGATQVILRSRQDKGQKMAFAIRKNQDALEIKSSQSSFLWVPVKESSHVVGNSGLINVGVTTFEGDKGVLLFDKNGGSEIAVEVTTSKDSTLEVSSSSLLSPMSLFFRRAILGRINPGFLRLSQDDNSDVLKVWSEEDAEAIAREFNKDRKEVDVAASYLITEMALEIGATVRFDKNKRGMFLDSELIKKHKLYNIFLKDFMKSLNKRLTLPMEEGEQWLIPNEVTRVTLQLNIDEKSRWTLFSKEGKELFSQTLEVSNFTRSNGSFTVMDVDNAKEFETQSVTIQDDDGSKVKVEVEFNSREGSVDLIIENRMDKFFSVILDGNESQRFLERGELSPGKPLFVPIDKGETKQVVLKSRQDPDQEITFFVKGLKNNQHEILFDSIDKGRWLSLFSSQGGMDVEKGELIKVNVQPYDTGVLLADGYGGAQGVVDVIIINSEKEASRSRIFKEAPLPEDTQSSSSPLVPTSLIFKRAVWDHMFSRLYIPKNVPNRRMVVIERQLRNQVYLNVWRLEDTAVIAKQFDKNPEDVHVTVKYMIEKMALGIGATSHVDEGVLSLYRLRNQLGNIDNFLDLIDDFVDRLEKRRLNFGAGEALTSKGRIAHFELERGREYTWHLYSRSGEKLFSQTIYVPPSLNPNAKQREGYALRVKDVDSGQEFIELHYGGLDDGFDITVEALDLYDNYPRGWFKVKTNRSDIFSVVLDGYEQKLFDERELLFKGDSLLVRTLNGETKEVVLRSMQDQSKERTFSIRERDGQIQIKRSKGRAWIDLSEKGLVIHGNDKQMNVEVLPYKGSQGVELSYKKGVPVMVEVSSSPAIIENDTTVKASSTIQGIGQNNPGGIDFNPALLDLQIKRDGNGVPLPVHQQPIQDMNIEGFLPVIINVSPISIPMLLGLVDQDEPIDSAQNKSDSNVQVEVNLIAVKLKLRFELSHS